ncbi:L-threonylcarbamoyladenylate synthase [SAR86 cluster bacterium]|nr:L-threonylcarbamoyladenylate synthase [SAR86 cluster bacterium]
MKEFNCPELASNWLKAGKILLHPTEGLWGIGCIVDSTAINLLSNLKRRNNKKGYIILVPNLEDVRRLFQLKPKYFPTLHNIWPGPVTVIMKTKNNSLSLVSDYNNNVAVRVSDHYHLKNLLTFLGQPMISTSANISGEQNIFDLDDIRNTFNDPNVALFNKPLGKTKKASTIIDIESMQIIRK